MKTGVLRSLLQKVESCSPSLYTTFPLSVVHLSISMLMPCNDLRRTEVKEVERNYFVVVVAIVTKTWHKSNAVVPICTARQGVVLVIIMTYIHIKKNSELVVFMNSTAA